jgi:hypothetical protein
LKAIFFILILGTNICIKMQARSEEDNSKVTCASALSSSDLSLETATYARALAELVKRDKRLPSKDDLAWKLRSPVGSLNDFFRRPENPSNIKDLYLLAREHFPKPFSELRSYAVRMMATYFTDHYKEPSPAELFDFMRKRNPKIAGLSDSEFSLLYDLNDLVSEAMGKHPNHFSGIRSDVIRAFGKVTKTVGRIPTDYEMAEALELSLGEYLDLFNRYKVFDSVKALKQLAWDDDNHQFRDAINTDIYNPERLLQLEKAILNRERLIVTTAVAGQSVNRDFLGALISYCKKNDCEILVFPANMQTTGLDPILLETQGLHIITNSILLSPWLTLNDIKIGAKQIDPLTGLDRLAPVGQSQIIGSPKIRSKVIATSLNALNPHRLITTGAITDPLYNGKHYIHKRSDEIAENDHVLGAVILEKSVGQALSLGLPASGFFHPRHIEFVRERHGFTDLDSFYSIDAIKNQKVDSLIFGDVHVGDTDPKIEILFRPLIRRLKPNYLIFHDFFNGHSVNGHDRHRRLTLAQDAEASRLNLESELRANAAFLNAVLAISPHTRAVIVPSNHNFWLDRWLDEGAYFNDPINARLGHQLALVKLQGHSPYQYALENFGLDKAKRSRIIFLGPGESFRRGPPGRQVELGVHGHMGINGAKGSLRSLMKTSDRIVFGHVHTDQRWNGSVSVGTSTKLHLRYNRDGLSNWIQTLATVSVEGEIQVVQLQGDEWFRRPSDNIPESKVFFMPSYPRIVPNNLGEPETPRIND